METVFRIRNCLAENQVNFATCTLLAGALTWWNSHVRIIGNDAAYVMTWIELKNKMADKYCPRNEMKKIETEFWNLEVQASKPKTMQEATKMATGLMDKKIRTYAERQAANKRKFKDTSRNNQGRQQPPKRQDVARAYAAGSGARQMPMLPTIRGVMGRVRKLLVMSAGHKDISKGTNPDANTVTGTFLLNNCYASVLFDTGADRSFLSTAFSSQFIITPTILDHDYAVELADGRIVGVNTGRETLIFLGDGSNQENEARLNIISCANTQKYMLKGCQVFLAHVTTKEAEGKSEKKRLENISIVRDFPKIFPEDLSGLPSTRQMLKGSRYFSRIDLCSGYHKLRVHEANIRKTASMTQYGHFEFTVMPFGLTIAPSIFMDLMNWVSKLNLDKFVIMLIDDILTYLKSKEDHEVHLKFVLELLKKEKLFAKFSKCEFWLEEVHFLGHMVNNNGIHVVPSKRYDHYWDWLVIIVVHR
nr:putative reverse transcriptase domain-containing protein [Tanacetum cinerariifolium]